MASSTLEMQTAADRAYEEHNAWLSSLRAAHARQVARHAEPTGLPSAPMTWAQQPNAIASTPSPYGSRAARHFGNADSDADLDIFAAATALNDSDFDAPVYRSLGSLGDSDFDPPVYRSLGSVCSSGSDAATGAAQMFSEADAEPPVYRGFSDLLTTDSMAEDSEADWLQSMPPLVQRQNARGVSYMMFH